jgi:hypothetical protein
LKSMATGMLTTTALEGMTDDCDTRIYISMYAHKRVVGSIPLRKPLCFTLSLPAARRFTENLLFQRRSETKSFLHHTSSQCLQIERTDTTGGSPAPLLTSPNILSGGTSKLATGKRSVPPSSLHTPRLLYHLAQCILAVRTSLCLSIFHSGYKR